MNQDVAILERLQLACGFVPVDLATAANNGDWVSLKNYRRCLVVLFKAAGAAAEDPTITLQQATDVAGTGAKNLNFTTLYRKQGADVTAIAQWTKTTQAAANTYTNATLGDEQVLLAIEFSAEDLDFKNNFDCLRATVADVGVTAQLGALLYIMGEPRDHAAPASMASAIAN